MTTVLEATDLAIEYRTDHGLVRALDGATLAIEAGQTIGIVGESGSGKSTLGLAIGRLLPPSASVMGGTLSVLGQHVFELPVDRLRDLRRTELAFIFQNPMSSLDPTMSIGRQLGLIVGGRSGRDRLGSAVVEQLRRVGLKDAKRVAASYPHQLSGGMAQRAAIAMALVRQPRLIVADEPTASLDSTVRGQVLRLLFGLAREAGAALLFLSHDLRSIANHCDRVAVMYGGRVAEVGPADRVFSRPAHPYTGALLTSRPGGVPGERIRAIPGAPPILHAPSAGCAFSPRCGWAVARCQIERPSTTLIDGRDVLCHRAGDVLKVSERREDDEGVVARVANG